MRNLAERKYNGHELHELSSTPILAGGALIVAGGLVITFWKVG
jgi:hypothetical protein